jgi:hypothetical protein
MTDDIKTETARAIANAVKELREHGGSEKDVAVIVEQFKALTEPEAHRVEAGKVPD